MRNFFVFALLAVGAAFTFDLYRMGKLDPYIEQYLKPTVLQASEPALKQAAPAATPNPETVLVSLDPKTYALKSFKPSNCNKVEAGPTLGHTVCEIARHYQAELNELKNKALPVCASDSHLEYEKK